MKPDIKERWLNELLNYKQVRYALHDDRGFCILGTLADIWAKEVGEEWTGTGKPFNRLYKIVGNSGLLPFEVSEWACLKWKDVNSLRKLNDADGWTFYELKEWIQENL